MDNHVQDEAGTPELLRCSRLGSYRGYSTRAFSEIFQRVIAVDASEVFLGANSNYNRDRQNILYVHLHSRLDGLRRLRRNNVHVAMVDAEHEYSSVLRDTSQLLENFRHLKYLIYDDFGTNSGVARAIREFVQAGDLRVLGGVGNRPPWSFKNEVIQSWEGVVCEVTRLHNRTASRAFENAFGKWYAWFHSNLWESEDVITLQKDGSAVTSRGMGKWHLDRSQERAMTLEWPSHKTTAMGGRNAAPPVQELWYLRFDEDWEKFAAMRVDGAVATGVDQEVMHAIVRRLFVSASHEFCSSAKECGQRLQA